MLVRARAHEINWRLWMDGAIAALGTAALGAAFVFDFVADKATGTPIEVITTLAYPLGDIAMVSMVVGVVALTGWRPGRTWSLLLAGLAALVIADIAFTLQSTDGTLPGGEWIDPIYLVAAVCLGAAVWQPTAAAEITSRQQSDNRREIIVPALFAGVMIGLFGMQYFSATSGLSTVLWASTMTAVIVRLAMSDRENKALLEQVRTDPLTGLGNRGRMQVDLEGLCERASEEHPAAVLFLDLNGFKHFNDTFGHPEGDKLLTRLGHSLSAAVGEDGTAYRVGGDEFCVLLSCDKDRLDASPARRRGRSAQRGTGFEVGASWGAAAIPREASDPSEALRLADVRMYAQKESRGVTRDSAGPGLPQVSEPLRSARRRPGAESADQRVEGAADFLALRSGSSARATSIAASSRAPIRTWASGRTGWRSIAPASIAASRLASIRPGRTWRLSPASGPSRAPRGPSRRTIRCASGSVQAWRNISAPARIASSGEPALAASAGGDPFRQLRLDLLVDGLERSRLPPKWW